MSVFLKKIFSFALKPDSTFPIPDYYESVLTKEDKQFLKNLTSLEISNFFLFEQALIHRSFLAVEHNKSKFSNERLEFLGDAVLDMVVADVLFNNFPNENEGFLTEKRSILVRKSTLGFIANKIGLNNHIKTSFSASKTIDSGNYSILADALESLIAAIFLTFGYREAKKFLVNEILPLAEETGRDEVNYKSRYLELTQAELGQAPTYSVLDETGPDHDKIFVVAVMLGENVIAEGKGRSKKLAEQNAAKNALNLI